MKVFYSEEVKKHKIANLPILSLESTILAHGMPYPENYSFAKTTEDICRGLGVAPATVAVLDGDLCVGLSDDQLKRVCTDRNMLKLSKSDLPFALLKKQSGATTVSATLWIAYKAGLFVFSTGVYATLFGLPRGATSPPSSSRSGRGRGARFVERIT